MSFWTGTWWDQCVHHCSMLTAALHKPLWHTATSSTWMQEVRKGKCAKLLSYNHVWKSPLKGSFFNQPSETCWCRSKFTRLIFFLFMWRNHLFSLMFFISRLLQRVSFSPADMFIPSRGIRLCEDRAFLILSMAALLRCHFCSHISAFCSHLQRPLWFSSAGLQLKTVHINWNYAPGNLLFLLLLHLLFLLLLLALPQTKTKIKHISPVKKMNQSEQLKNSDCNAIGPS